MSDIEKYSGVWQIIVMGDINARTGNLPDAIENTRCMRCDHIPSIDILDSDDGFNARCSQDNHSRMCKYCHSLIGMYISTELKMPTVGF